MILYIIYNTYINIYSSDIFYINNKLYYNTIMVSREEKLIFLRKKNQEKFSIVRNRKNYIINTYIIDYRLWSHKILY